jgi:preprotein translocase subunit SecD
MRTAFFCSFLAATSLAMQACSPAPITTTARIELETATPEELAASVEILRKRFDDLRPAMRSSHAVKIAGSGIDLEFRGDAPSDDTIRFFAGSRGLLRFHSPRQRGLSVVTDRDVVRIVARKDESAALLDIALSPEAGERMREYTSKNVGQPLEVSIDGEVVSRAIINGTFGAQFETTGLETDFAKRIVGLVRHGRLPVAVRSVEVHHPAR